MPKNDGGPASPDKGVFPKKNSQGGILAIPPCTCLKSARIQAE